MWAPAEWPIRWICKRIAGGARDVLPHPRDRGRAVLDEGRKAHLGVAPVVGDDRNEAPRGQRLADEAEVSLAAGLPAAAVEEHHDRGRARARVRRIDVEPLEWPVAVGEVALDPVAAVRHQRVQEPRPATGAGQEGAGLPRGARPPGSGSWS